MTLAPEAGLLEAVLRRDRAVVAGALAAIVAIAWVWIAFGAGAGMAAVAPAGGMAGMAMEPAAWGPAYAVLVFAMWWVMMVAMMLPSATPMLLVFARVNRAERSRQRPYVPTGIFAAGYLAAWGGFSAAATLLQWSLQRFGLLSPMLTPTSYRLGGAILIVAGLWQLTPIKNVCLSHCRSPLGFLVAGWQPGPFGAFRLGLRHGAYCLGCCWLLMGLLFFGGVMNLLWIAGLAVFVLVEKVVPMGRWIGRVAGAGVAAWGMALILMAMPGGSPSMPEMPAMPGGQPPAVAAPMSNSMPMNMPGMASPPAKP